MNDDGYDEAIAARYDESSAGMFPTMVDPPVDFLVELAGGGPALELGIGTGRIALPLARGGVPVHRIELSQAMVARLRGDRLRITSSSSTAESSVSRFPSVMCGPLNWISWRNSLDPPRAQLHRLEKTMNSGTTRAG